jgi:hypothetical protein
VLVAGTETHVSTQNLSGQLDAQVAGNNFGLKPLELFRQFFYGESPDSGDWWRLSRASSFWRDGECRAWMVFTEGVELTCLREPFDWFS